MAKKVIYEPHPVTPERKQELVDKGYKIIDAEFAPEGYEYPASEMKNTDEPKKEKPKKAEK